MKVEELRIGNWVDYSMPTRVDIDNFMFLACNISEVEPIPLTEEILLKCGFDKALNLGVFHWCGHMNMVLEFDDGMNGFNYFTDIIYLHQLQNIYPFFNAGEELNIEL